MDLLAIKEVATKMPPELQPELLKALESIDEKNIDLNELDRPILEQTALKPDPEVLESEARPLTQEEKDDYREKLGCSPSLLESATISEDGKVRLKTINEGKEGQIGEDGVEYVRKTFEINDIEVEGVFPQFESAIDVQLPNEMTQATDSEQAKHGNQQLKEKIQSDPEFSKQFNEEQREQIENNDTPDGYTWHHNEESGKMQLISTEDHQNNRHTGGKAIWGGGRENR